jgi:hypothetical protein
MELSGQLDALAALPRGNRLHCPLDGRLGGLQSRSGRCGEEKNLGYAENRTLAVQPVAYRCADRHRLRYPLR